MLPVQDILRPFLMGLESKSPKLASISLVSIQKLCGHGALSDEGISSVAAALEQVMNTRYDDVCSMVSKDMNDSEANRSCIYRWNDCTMTPYS